MQIDYDSGRRPLTPEAVTAMRGLYDAEIATVDRAIGRLVAGLASRGYDERTLLLVVTADHGESLGEHGFVGHLRGLPEGVLHVPLLVAGPGVPPGEVAEPVQTVQLRSTLRTLLGLENLPGLAPALPPWGVAPSLVITEHPAVPFNRETRRALAAREDDPSCGGNWVAVERAGVKAIFDDRGHGESFRLADDPGEMHPRPLVDAVDLVRAYAAWRQP
jgi:arylsulfatase A-like enzyme